MVLFSIMMDPSYTHTAMGKYESTTILVFTVSVHQ